MLMESNDNCTKKMYFLFFFFSSKVSFNYFMNSVMLDIVTFFILTF